MGVPPEFPKNQKILAILEEEAGKQFDPDVVAAFMRGIGKEGAGIINNPGEALGRATIDPESFQMLTTALMEWLQFRLTHFSN